MEILAQIKSCCVTGAPKQDLFRTTEDISQCTEPYQFVAINDILIMEKQGENHILSLAEIEIFALISLLRCG